LQRSIDYTIKFNEIPTEELIYKYLLLRESETENYTTLDEHGKLKIFDSVEDIISYFVKFRLTFYSKRKEFIVNKLTKESLALDNKIKFIKAILDNKLKINNRKRDDITSDLTKMKFDQLMEILIICLRMAIYSLTKEMYEKLIADLEIKRKK